MHSNSTRVRFDEIAPMKCKETEQKHNIIIQRINNKILPYIVQWQYELIRA